MISHLETVNLRMDCRDTAYSHSVPLFTMSSWTDNHHVCDTSTLTHCGWNWPTQTLSKTTSILWRCRLIRETWRHLCNPCWEYHYVNEFGKFCSLSCFEHVGQTWCFTNVLFLAFSRVVRTVLTQFGFTNLVKCCEGFKPRCCWNTCLWISDLSASAVVQIKFRIHVVWEQFVQWPQFLPSAVTTSVKFPLCTNRGQDRIGQGDA